MNGTSRSRRLDALPDRPLSDLVRTSGEEAVQVEHLAHRRDDLGEPGLGAQLLALLFDSGVIAQLSQTLFKACRNRENRVARRVGLDVFHELGQVLVLLADVVPLAQVDQVHNRLGSEQEERVDNFDLWSSAYAFQCLQR